MVSQSILSTLLAACVVGPVGATDDDPLDLGDPVVIRGDNDYVTREEYESLKQQLELVLSQLESRDAVSSNRQPDEFDVAVIEQMKREMHRTHLELEVMKSLNETWTPDAETRFLVTGYMHTLFSDVQDESSSFSALFAPVILWRVNDRLLVEAELEITIGDGGHAGAEAEEDGGHDEELGPAAAEGGHAAGGSSSEVEIGYAHASYILNDYFTVGAGKFLTPFGLFGERLHPSWINKLPNAPFAFAHGGGIAPTTSVGAYVRGGTGLWDDAKINYSFYVSNGPSLVDAVDDADAAGSLEFGSSSDNNNNKALGGRFGFMPSPEIEFGYSLQTARVNGHDLADADALIQGFDVSFVDTIEEISGHLDVRFEWVWSDVDEVMFELADGDMLQFGNKRSGGYIQTAYRPTLLDDEYLRNVEFVCRWDQLDVPVGSHAGDKDQERWTVGVNYWLAPASVVKLAYQMIDTQGHEDQDAFLMMFSTGF